MRNSFLTSSSTLDTIPVILEELTNSFMDLLEKREVVGPQTPSDLVTHIRYQIVEGLNCQFLSLDHARYELKENRHQA